MRSKNIITWKDADQNLCQLAAVMLKNAMQELRNSGKQDYPLDMDNGKEVPPGYVEDEGSQRTIYSDTPATAILTPGDEETYIEVMGDLIYFFDTGRPSAICWWSFQNLIRWRLKKARRELYQNLYGSKEFKGETEKNCSRNLKKRPQESKFGRKAERE